MAVPAHVTDTARREQVNRLAADFSGTLPRPIVEAEVRAAERELAGQVPSGAVAEMLHRLVVCRLQQRVTGAS